MTQPRHIPPIPDEANRVAQAVFDAIFAVHREIGPGLLESVYEKCLIVELCSAGLAVARQVSIPIVYKGARIDENLRVDLIVGGQVMVEVKSVERLHPVHTAQVISYLKLSGLRIGYLVNFNVPLIKDGLHRYVV